MEQSGDSKQTLDISHLKMLEEMLKAMKFGSITLIVQDGKIIQIDKTEKYRVRD